MPNTVPPRIAFVVGEFPVVSETFIIKQIADLADRGIFVDIFSFKKGDSSLAADRYRTYRMHERTHVLAMPQNVFLRLFKALGCVFTLLWYRPSALVRLVHLLREPERRREVLSLKYLFWVAPFANKTYALVHCHFGTIATKYLIIREILGDRTPFITSLYGYDISHTVKEKGPEVYASLHAVCSRYIVMSRNMRERAIAAGFPAERIEVLPISLTVSDYQFSTHERKNNEPVRLTTIARLVEKKGIDDLLRALALLKKKTDILFHVTVIGDGPLHDELTALSDSLGVNNEVTFTGSLRQEEANTILQKSHIYVQPSKTARDGDME